MFGGGGGNEDDDELALFMQEFMDVQETQTGTKLSERSCIELILKLIELHKLEVVFASSGKEVVTPEHIVREVQDQLRRHGGRLCIVNIPELLALDLSHIERAVAVLLSESKSQSDSDSDVGEVTLLNGYLLSAKYIDDRVEEVWAAVAESGVASLTTLSQQVNLPIQFLTEAIMARPMLGSLRGASLYTQAFVDTQNATTRGILLGTTVPASLRELATQADLQHDLFLKETNRLLEAGLLPGGLIGSGISAQYRPDIYVRSQEASVRSFFLQNGYISKDRISGVGIAKPQQYLAQHFPDGVMLKNLFVSSTFKESVLAAVEEALSEGTWCDASVVLPSVLDPEDVSCLLQLCVSEANQSVASGDAKLVVVGSTFAISSDFRTQIIDASKPTITRMAKEAAVKMRQSKSKPKPAPVPSSSSGPTSPPASKGKGKKGGRSTKNRGGKRGAAAAAEDDEEEPVSDDEEESRGSKGKRGKNKRSNKRNARHEADEADEAIRTQKETVVMDLDPVLEFLAEEFPDCPETLLSELARIAKPVWSKHFRTQRDSLFVVDAGGDTKKRHQQMAKCAQELYEKICMFGNAIHSIEEAATAAEESNEAVQQMVGLLHRHLLRTLCSHVTDIFLRNQAMHYDAEPDSDKGNDDASVSTDLLSKEDRRYILNRLPPRVGEQMQTLLASLSATTMSVFQKELSKLADECEIPLSALPRKKEKTLVFGMKRALMQQIESESRPEPLLLLVVIVLHSQLYGCILHAPNRVLASLIQFLFASLTDDAQAVIKAVAKVVDSNAAENADDNDEVDSETLQKLRTIGLNPSASLVSS